MKLLVVVVLLVVSFSAQPADVVVDWTADTSASIHRTYTSTDAALTWAVGPESTTLPITVTIPDTGITDVMACSVRGQLEVCSTKAWFRFKPDGLVPKDLMTPGG